MCGIAAVLHKNGAVDHPVGEALIQMGRVLGSRGTDSTGVALYRPLPPASMVLRVFIESRNATDPSAVLNQVLERLGAVVGLDGSELTDNLARVLLSGLPERPGRDFWDDLVAAVESCDGAQLFSLGAGLEVVKDTGPAARLAERHGVDAFLGTHGLVHTRLATESRVDIAHAHPFWARPFPDVAVVHNGQLTNHYKLRRRLERRGYGFLTSNDSEIIAVYLGDRLADGDSLSDAMAASVEEMDGTFTYLAATADAIGLAKDRFDTKPLVVAECDAYVAMASEEIALRPLIAADCVVSEPAARTVQTWSR